MGGLTFFMAATAHAQIDENQQIAASLAPYRLNNAQITQLQAGEPALDIWANAEKKSIVEAFGAIDIAASPEQIWAIMTDCDQQLKIVQNMTRCAITAKNIEAGWDERVQVLDIGWFLPKVKSKFRSNYTPYREIKITRSGGDLSVLNGQWRLIGLANGLTRVTYRAQLKPKLPVPRGLIRKATRKDMPKVLRNLKALAQKQAAIFNNISPDTINPDRPATIERKTAHHDNIDGQHPQNSQGSQLNAARIDVNKADIRHEP